jgi:hypothetical protein
MKRQKNEVCIVRSSTICALHHVGDLIKKDEMGGAHRAHVADEKLL